MTTFDRLLVGGHSYSAGVGASARQGIIDNLDLLHGLFSGVADTFLRPDPASWVDTFTRADSATTLGSTEAPVVAWNPVTGTWGIGANGARLVTSGGTHNVAGLDTGHADGVLTVTFSTRADQMGVAFRIVDANNFLLLKIFTAFGTAQLFKVVAGVQTAVGSFFSSDIANGCSYLIAMRGSTITVASKSSSGLFAHRTTQTVTDHQTATVHGLYAIAAVAGGTARWDNLTFEMAALGASERGAVTPTEVAGTWSVKANTMQLLAPVPSNVLAWECGHADGQFDMVLGANNPDHFGVAFRVTDASNFCYIDFAPSLAAYQLHEVIAGVDSLIGAAVLFGAAPGSTVRVIMLGTRVRIGGATGGYTDRTVTNTTGTKHGLWAKSEIAQKSGVFDQVAFSFIQHYGVSGSAVSRHDVPGSYVDILRQFPIGLTSDDLVVFMWGINDLTFAGGGVARSWRACIEAFRVAISRALTTAVFGDSDASVAYTAGWSTVSATDKNHGVGYHASTTVGDIATITVPGGFGGGTIALGFIGPPDSAGGTATITVDGVFHGTVDTTGLYLQAFGTGNFWCGLVHRITELAAGGHAIEITVASAGATGICFDYWQEEQASGPTILVTDTARLPAYTGFWAGITDDQVTTLNGMLTGLLAEFGGAATFVSMDAVLQKDPTLFQGGAFPIHPIDAGTLKVALALFAAFNIVPPITPTPLATFGEHDAEFRYLVEDITSQRVIGTLPLYGVQYEDFIRRPGSGRSAITMRDADDNIDLLEPGTRAIYIERNGVIQWGGRLIATPIGLGDEHVGLVIEGWLGYWDHRDIWTDRQFTDIDQFEIFKTLVDDAQDPAAVVDPVTLATNGAGADVGITVEWDALSGVSRTRVEEYRYFGGKNLGAALRELAALDDGFDFAMQYTRTADQIIKTIKLFHPRMGRDHSNEIGFEYERGRQSNVLRRGLTRDASKMAWRVRGWGAGAEVSRLRSDQISEARRGLYPFLDGQGNFSSVVEQATLDDQTIAAAGAQDHPIVVPALEVDPARDPKWSTYSLGDTFRVRIDDGLASADGPHRIIGYRMNADVDRPTLFFEEV